MITLNIVHRIVLKVKGDSPKNKYAVKGKVTYERPKKINLVDHTEPVLSVKYVHAFK